MPVTQNLRSVWIHWRWWWFLRLEMNGEVLWISAYWYWRNNILFTACWCHLTGTGVQQYYDNDIGKELSQEISLNGKIGMWYEKEEQVLSSDCTRTKGTPIGHKNSGDVNSQHLLLKSTTVHSAMWSKVNAYVPANRRSLHFLHHLRCFIQINILLQIFQELLIASDGSTVGIYFCHINSEIGNSHQHGVCINGIIFLSFASSSFCCALNFL